MLAAGVWYQCRWIELSFTTISSHRVQLPYGGKVRKKRALPGAFIRGCHNIQRFCSEAEVSGMVPHGHEDIHLSQRIPAFPAAP